MTLFPLTNEEKSRLQKLSNDRSVIFALKKLFLNSCSSEPPSNEAISKITKAFHDLSIIQPDNQTGKIEENLV